MKDKNQRTRHAGRYGIARRLTVLFTTCLLLFALILGLAFSALLYRYARQSYVENLKHTASSISEMVAAIGRRRGSFVIGEPGGNPGGDPGRSDEGNAGDLGFGSDNWSWDGSLRYDGQSVRAVCP